MILFGLLALAISLLVLLLIALVVYYFLKWIIRDAVYEALVRFQKEQEENNNCSK